MTNNTKKPRSKKVSKVDKPISATECICILDKSGSMYHLTNDTIGGYNKMLSEQRKISGEARFSLILFDCAVKPVYESMPLAEVPDLTEKEYNPTGTTALYDAIGQTITSLKQRTESMAIPPKVIITVFTDGEENASRTYNKVHIRGMIEFAQESGWEFVFIGAGIDAMTEGSSLGFQPSQVHTVSRDAKGMDQTFGAVSRSYFSARL